jgi:hypothetical protein
MGIMKLLNRVFDNSGEALAEEINKDDALIMKDWNDYSDYP